MCGYIGPRQVSRMRRTPLACDEPIPKEALLNPLNAHERDILVTTIPGATGVKSLLCASELVSGKACRDPIDKVTAAEANQLYLHTRDQYNNFRTLADTVVTMSALVSGQSSFVAVTFTYCTACARGGIYIVTLVPTTSGTHEILVRIDGEDLTTGPYMLDILPGEVSAPHSLLSGMGISQATAGDLAVFYLTLRDSYENVRGSSGGAMISISPASVSVEDVGDGVFKFTYTRNLAGTFLVDIFVDGKHVVAVAPHQYTITVQPRPLDPTSATRYMFSMTLFPTSVKRDTPDRIVIFGMQDEFGNEVSNDDTISMVCEASGKEDFADQGISGKLVPLDIAPRPGFPGQFNLNLKFAKTGEYSVSCMIVKRGGVNARYYNNRWLQGEPAAKRIDTNIHFDWGMGLISPDASDMVSAHWDGFMSVDVEGDYTLYLSADDSAKLWVDSKLLISFNTASEGIPTILHLYPGRLYGFQVAFYEVAEAARISLQWESIDAGVLLQPIPFANLYHSRSQLESFPKTLQIYDRPAKVEAFYRAHPFAYGTPTLVWLPPLDDGESAILQYQIVRSKSTNAGPWTEVYAGTKDILNFTDTLLDTDVPYYYRILAHNGDDGDYAEITVWATVLPLQPSVPEVSAASETALQFKLDPPEKALERGYAVIFSWSLFRDGGLGGAIDIEYTGNFEFNPLELEKPLIAYADVANLIPGRMYRFQVQYWTRVGSSPRSLILGAECCNFSPPPEPVRNVRRSSNMQEQSDEKIQIAWDPITDTGSSELAYYRIYVDDGVSETIERTADGTITVLTVSMLVEKKVYRFAVTAVNAAGEGPRSERVTLVVSEKPSAPVTDPTTDILFQSTERIHIKWDAPAYEGGAGLSGYRLYTDMASGGATDNLIYDGSDQACTLEFDWRPQRPDLTSALVAGATYKFQVIAINPTGPSSESQPLVVIAATKPLRPDTPYSDAAVTTSSQISLHWAAPSDGGTPIRAYVIEKMKLGSDFGSNIWNVLVDAAALLTDTFYLDTDVLARRSYRYRLYATNDVTLGDILKSPEATIIAASLPSKPINCDDLAPGSTDPCHLRYVSSTETTITVSWSSPTSDTPITGYKLYLDNVIVYDGDGNTGTLTFTLSGCETGLIHDFRLTALSESGESPQSTPLSRVCARRPYPPGAPELVESTQSPMMMRISWTPPTRHGGIPISGFRILRAHYDNYDFQEIFCRLTDGTAVNIVPAELHECKDDNIDCTQGRCKYKVVALNGVEDLNNDDASNYVLMKAANLPNPPTTITRGPAMASTVITLEWSAVTDQIEAGYDLVTGYRLYANTGIDDDVTELLFDGQGLPSQRTFTHENLVPGRYYRYQVSSLNTAGGLEGTRSTVKIFLATEPPLAPSAPVFVDANRGGTLTIKWDPPTDIGGSVLRNYLIWHNDGTVNSPLTQSIEICDPGVTSYQLTSLAGGRFYSIAIQAFTSCTDGDFIPLDPTTCPTCSLSGPRSEVGTFVVADLPPNINIAVLPKTQTKTSITIYWPYETGDGGTFITHHNVYRDDGLGGDYVHVATLPTSHHITNPLALPVQGNEYIYTGLITGRVYHFYAEMCSERGCSPSGIMGPITCASPPGQPPAPEIVATTEAAVVVSWEPPEENGGMPITKVRLERDDTDGLLGALSQEILIPIREYNDTTVTSGATYRYRVFSINEIGDSLPSFVTLVVAASVPAQPLPVTVVSQNRDYITVDWVSPASGGARVTRHVLERDDGLGGPYVPIYDGPALVHSQETVGNRVYRFRVSSFNLAGQSPWSDLAEFRSVGMPTEVGAPQRVTSACGSGLNNGEITVKWSAPLDDGGCPIEKYFVMRIDVATGVETQMGEQDASQTSYRLVNQNCGDLIKVRIDATNCVGKVRSPALELPIASLPGKTSNLQGASNSATSLLYSWDLLDTVTLRGSVSAEAIVGYELWMDDGLGGDFVLAYNEHIG